MSKANLNNQIEQDIAIGNSLRIANGNSPCPASKRSLGDRLMLSLQDQKLLKTTSGKKTPPSQTQSLNLALNHFEEIEILIGKPCLILQNQETSHRFLQTYWLGKSYLLSLHFNLPFLHRYYNNLTKIAKDNLQPIGQQREVFVFWGKTGTGKSRRAWDEAGLGAYPKDPNTKFWDGYASHQHVVIDEYRGGININHLLRWFDRYPVIIEVKGGAHILLATKIWITSNLSPNEWYPDLDQETLAALRRRLTITHFN